MDNIKQINTGVAEIIAVKVPEWAREFKVFHDERPYLSFFDGYTTPRIYLPCDAEIVGISDQLTEEQCRRFMREQVRLLPRLTDDLNELVRTEVIPAKEAFASLMQANGINEPRLILKAI